MLFDRVVNVDKGITVPLGLRGTIVGIYEGMWLLFISFVYSTTYGEVFLLYSRLTIYSYLQEILFRIFNIEKIRQREDMIVDQINQEN